MHLPISSEDIFHFYRYLHTHTFIADKQFLLLIDVPIEDCAQQLKIYEVFNLVIPHRNLSVHYNIDSKYLGISYDETKAVEISEQQFSTGKQANGQYCGINGPLQPLANSPSCNAATHTKNKTEIEKRCSLQIRNTNNATNPTPIVPNVWILTSAPTAELTGITIICHQDSSKHRHSSTFFTYHQHVAIHLNIFTYHPIMKLIS